MTRICVKVTIMLLLTVGSVLGTIGTAGADGLADRFFQIQVKQVSNNDLIPSIPPDPPGPNCYSFLAGGIWIDPLFLNPFGTYTVTEGVVTRYRAEAVFGPLLLVQEGQVTPTTRRGQVRLTAFSTLYLFGEDGPVLAEFVSTGYEADGCPP